MRARPPADLEIKALNPNRNSCGQEFYLRELVRLTQLAPRTVQRELNNLVAADLLLERRDGNRRYFRANERHPLFAPLREIVLKTDGLAGVLQHALEGAPVEAAFVFGSMASGAGTAGSDVDLLIVGSLGSRETVKRLRPAQEKLGREINPVVWTASEYGKRLAAGDHFLTTLLREPRLMVVGDEQTLRELGQQRLAQTTPDVSRRNRRPARRRRG